MNITVCAQSYSKGIKSALYTAKNHENVRINFGVNGKKYTHILYDGEMLVLKRLSSCLVCCLLFEKRSPYIINCRANLKDCFENLLEAVIVF